MRHLGIDYGTRRLGMALSDAGGTLVTPLAVVDVTTDAVATGHVRRTALREGAEVLVVGLPVNMDGSEGPSARRVRAWCANLSKATGLPVVLVDERRSSIAAEEVLAERRRGGENLTHKRKKRRLDAVAAAMFLQAYLDGELPALQGQSDVERDEPESGIGSGVARG